MGRAAEHHGARQESVWARAGARPSDGQLRGGAGAGQSYPNYTRFKTKAQVNPKKKSSLLSVDPIDPGQLV